MYKKTVKVPQVRVFSLRNGGCHERSVDRANKEANDFALNCALHGFNPVVSATDRFITVNYVETVEVVYCPGHSPLLGFSAPVGNIVPWIDIN